MSNRPSCRERSLGPAPELDQWVQLATDAWALLVQIGRLEATRP